MEPVNVSSNTQLTITTSEQVEGAISTNESTEQSNDSFLATIVRLDQSAAERLFRAATL